MSGTYTVEQRNLFLGSLIYNYYFTQPLLTMMLVEKKNLPKLWFAGEGNLRVSPPLEPPTV